MWPGGCDQFPSGLLCPTQLVGELLTSPRNSKGFDLGVTHVQWCSMNGTHMRLASSACQSAAGEALLPNHTLKQGLNLLSWFAMPMNRRSSECDFGFYVSRIAYVFCGSAEMLFLSMTWPRNVTHSLLNLHFSLLSVRPAA